MKKSLHISKFLTEWFWKRWYWKSLNLTKVVRPQSALALRARALLLVFEKFTLAYLFQIALEIMWLLVQICDTYKRRQIDPGFKIETKKIGKVVVSRETNV